MLHAAADASFDAPILSCGYVLTQSDGGEETFIDAGMRILNTEEVRPEIEWCPSRGEYRAVITAVRAALSYSDQPLLVYTDNVPVRDAILGDNDPFEEYFHHCLCSFLGRFPHWHVLDVDRERNVAAHEQARVGLKLGRRILDLGKGVSA